MATKNYMIMNRYAGVLLCLLLSCATFGQRFDADSLFAQARKIAYEQKRYNDAISYGKRVLDAAPAYTDVQIFVGRVYAWQGNYDSAARYLQRALELDAKYEDAYVAYADLDQWHNHHKEALVTVNKGLGAFPDSRELLLRKARSLTALKDFRPAMEITARLLAAQPGNAEIRALLVQLRELSCRNKVSIGGDYIHFDKQFPDDWRFASVELVNGTRLGAWAVRVNVANRFSKPGIQYEADLYPRLSRTFYLYMNFGYGDHIEAFPRWRGGFSIFANLPKAFEAEAGVRYLYYTGDAYFYTAYLGKYYKRFQFGARTYITPEVNVFSNSFGPMIRYYYGGTDDHVTLNASRGISADNRRFLTNLYGDGTRPSYFAELILKKSFRTVNIITLNASLYNYQYRKDVIGNQYQFGIAYTKRFL